MSPAPNAAVVPTVNAADAHSVALLCPGVGGQVPADLAEGLRADGFRPAAEDDPGRLADFLRRGNPPPGADGGGGGTLLLDAARLPEGAWGQLTGVIEEFHAAGWDVLGLAPAVDPGAAVSHQLLALGVGDVCLGAPPWTLLRRRLAHRAEERARGEEHARLSRAIQLAPCGLTITDALVPDNPIIYANEGFQRMTGYAPEEFLGRNCRFLQQGRGDQPAVAALREAIAAGESCQVTLLNFHRDGEFFYNELAVSPLRDATGRVTNFVGVQNDVTARTKAILALQESEERFRTLANLLPTRIWLADAGLRFEFLNEAWRDCLPANGGEPDADHTDDADADDLNDDRGWLRWVHPGDRSAAADALVKARETQRPLGFETRLVRPDGEARWFAVEGVPRLDPNGAWRGLLGSATDITENRAAQDMMGRRMRQFSLQTMILRQLVGGGPEAAANGHGDAGGGTAVAGVLAMLGDMAGASALHLLEFSEDESARMTEVARWEEAGGGGGGGADGGFAGRRLREVLPFSAVALLGAADPVTVRPNELRRLHLAGNKAGPDALPLMIAPVRRGRTTVGALAAVGRPGGEDGWLNGCADLLRDIAPTLPALLAGGRRGKPS